MYFPQFNCHVLIFSFYFESTRLRQPSTLSWIRKLKKLYLDDVEQVRDTDK